MRLKHLIVVLPGIGGSVLARPGAAPVFDASAATIGRVLARPSDVALSDVAELVPVDYVRTRMVVPPVFMVPGYDRLLQRLRERFGAIVDTYRPDRPAHTAADVLVVPYDFRRSFCETAAWLNDAVNRQLAGMSEAECMGRVIVVAHSMGGLVARYWLGAFDGWKYCRALLTAGTPHRGAPKALDLLVNGVRLGPLVQRRATHVLRDWPSVYELLPQYPAVWDAAAKNAIEPTDLPAGCIRGDGSLAESADWFARKAGDAAKAHEELAAAWARIPTARAPRLVPFFSRGHATPNRAEYADARLSVSKDDPEWRGNVGLRGDGTVPAISAIPPDLNERPDSWRPATEPHGLLSATEGILRLLEFYALDALPTRGVPGEPSPWLGLDLDDVVPAGQETPLGTRVLASPDAPGAAIEALAAARVDAVVRSLDRPDEPPSRARMRAVEDRWQALLPPSVPGTYQVTLQASGVPGVGAVYGTAQFAAVVPETPETPS